MKRKLIFSVLLLCCTAGILLAAGNPQFILQFQNAGTNLGTWLNYVKINCSTGMSCTASGSTVTMTASSTGGVSSVSGTTNQIDVATGTSTPVISLDSAITLPGTINKYTLTAPATGSTLTIADGKTLTVSNSLTLAGTDGQTMTFPSTSATIARTDAANTFTGHQTIEGVTSTGATGTGNLVFATAPTFPSTLTVGTNGGTGGSATYNGSTSGNVTAGCVGATCTGFGGTASVAVFAQYQTGTNCSGVGTSASPSVVTCTSAAAGAFSCATNATGATCTINTTAAHTNSDIIVTPTASAGTRLSVTCNTTADTPTAPRIAAIVNNTSFTINLGTVATNPMCFFFTITN